MFLHIVLYSQENDAILHGRPLHFGKDSPYLFNLWAQTLDLQMTILFWAHLFLDQTLVYSLYHIHLSWCQINSLQSEKVNPFTTVTPYISNWCVHGIVMLCVYIKSFDVSHCYDNINTAISSCPLWPVTTKQKIFLCYYIHSELV